MAEDSGSGRIISHITLKGTLIMKTTLYRFGQLFTLLFALGFTGNALAEDCYRGTLDEQYCDRDRDQVAD